MELPGPLWPYMLFFGFALIGGWDFLFDLVNRLRRARRETPRGPHTRVGRRPAPRTRQPRAYVPLKQELEDYEHQIDCATERVS